MPRTVILGTARTPVGKLGGGLSTLRAPDLGGIAIKAALERAEVAPEQVQHVVMGQVLQAGTGQIPSRQAQIEAGIPIEVTSETINKVCASSVRAVGMIDQAVRAGDLEVAVGGGMESMSQAPYLLPGARSGFRMGDVKALDAHTLLIVSEVTSIGIPALICACRLGIWPCPACSTVPITTCSTWVGSTSARCSASRIATPPRCVAGSVERPPPSLPIGVRALLRITVRGIGRVY